MKKLIPLLFFILLAAVSYAQDPKLDENAKTTSDQRFVNESNRKSKQGKKKVSTKEKVKIQKKQARAAERTKSERAKKRKPKKK